MQMEINQQKVHKRNCINMKFKKKKMVRSNCLKRSQLASVLHSNNKDVRLAKAHRFSYCLASTQSQEGNTKTISTLPTHYYIGDADINGEPQLL